MERKPVRRGFELGVQPLDGKGARADTLGAVAVDVQADVVQATASCYDGVR